MTSPALAVARALFREAKAAGELKPVEDDLALLAAVCTDGDLQRFMLHPRISLPTKMTALAPALRDGLVRRLFGALLAARETALVPSIYRSYTQMVKHETGFVDTIARVARPLTPTEEAELRAAVAHATGYTALLHVTVDPTLIGGVRLAIDGRIADNSIKTGLESLKEKLLAS